VVFLFSVDAEKRTKKPNSGGLGGGLKKFLPSPPI